MRYDLILRNGDKYITYDDLTTQQVGAKILANAPDEICVIQESWTTMRRPKKKTVKPPKLKLIRE